MKKLLFCILLASLVFCKADVAFGQTNYPKSCLAIDTTKKVAQSHTGFTIVELLGYMFGTAIAFDFQQVQYVKGRLTLPNNFHIGYTYTYSQINGKLQQNGSIDVNTKFYAGIGVNFGFVQNPDGTLSGQVPAGVVLGYSFVGFFAGTDILYIQHPIYGVSLRVPIPSILPSTNSIHL